MTATSGIQPRSGEAMLGDFLSGTAEGRADLVEKGSFSIAIVDAAGSMRWTDAAFADLLADTAASLDCRRLARAVQKKQRVAGLVATSRGAIVFEARLASAAGEWPLPEIARRTLGEAADRVLLIAFAPSRAPGFALVSAVALGLAPREADLAAALLEAPNLRLAAQRAGMSAETAKDALARACRKAGVRGASELVGTAARPELRNRNR